jgi:hypothetical protein
MSACPLRFVSIVLAGIAVSAATACAVDAEDDSDSSAGAQSRAGSVVDIDEDYAAIEDVTSSVCDPTTGRRKDYAIKDDVPITTPPDKDYSKDTTPAPTTDATAFDVQAYIAGRSGPAPKKFAAATVLAAMRRLRRYYFTNPFTQGGTSVSIQGSHGPSASTGKCEPGFNDTFDNCKYMFNLTDDGSTGLNMDAMPIWWSDIHTHFFTMAPHFRHACWTAGIRFANINKLYRNGTCTTPFEADKTVPMRQAIREFCSGEKVVTTGCATFEDALPYVTANFSAYNLMWVNPATKRFVALPEDIRTDIPPASLASTVADVPKIRAAQFAKKQREAGMVNVWDYVTESALYAFDFEQQQAVLNAYYAEDMNPSDPAAARAAFDPCDQNMCNTWRAKRPGDPEDGTHCRTNKIMSAMMLSNGQ